VPFHVAPMHRALLNIFTGPRSTCASRRSAILPHTPTQRRGAYLQLHIRTPTAFSRTQHLQRQHQLSYCSDRPGGHKHQRPDLSLCLELQGSGKSRDTRVPRQSQPSQESPSRASGRLLNKWALVSTVPMVVEMASAQDARESRRRLAHKLQCAYSGLYS
jgi:hypothetical protein